MKICNVSSSYGVYNNKPAVSRTKASDGKTIDSYDVSSVGKDFNAIYKSVMQSSDIREDKVNSISQQIEEGTYNVSAEDLADKLLSKLM